MRKAAPCPLKNRTVFQNLRDAVALQRLAGAFGPHIHPKSRPVSLRNRRGDAALQTDQVFPDQGDAGFLGFGVGGECHFFFTIVSERGVDASINLMGDALARIRPLTPS